jgi:cell division protein FtsQ
MRRPTFLKRRRPVVAGDDFVDVAGDDFVDVTGDDFVDVVEDAGGTVIDHADDGDDPGVVVELFDLDAVDGDGKFDGAVDGDGQFDGAVDGDGQFDGAVDGDGTGPHGWKPGRAWVVATVAVLVAAVAAAVALLTPALHVRDIEVVGATHTGDDEVLRMAGSVGDKSLLEVNARSVRSSVRRLPWVDDVAVVRSFPWTLRLEVSERIPAAIVEAPGARAVLDAEGRVLENLPPDATVAGLAKVVGTTPLPGPGSVWADPNGIGALAAMQGLPVEFVSLVDRVEIGPEGELQMATVDGTTVRFGVPDAVEQKGAVALQVVRDLQRRNVTAESIDVSAPLAPAYKAVPPPKPEPPVRKRPRRPT